MPDSERLRVFVVDDDAFVADATSTVLRHAGYDVFTFYNAVSAAQEARKSPPKVVVTDYEMPEMNGLVFAAWLRENCPDCKVIIHSGQAAVVAEQAIVGLRFTLLEEPVAPNVLIDAVQEWGPSPSF